MNAKVEVVIPDVIGTPFCGGFYAGRIMVGDKPHALIVAPKAVGEFEATWNSSRAEICGAKSYCDGYANTEAMVAAGSKLAKDIVALNIDGNTGWYLPSQDELEILYRVFKPTEETNTGYARSGINLSAVPPTRPYEPDMPAQTAISAFQAGGAEAFDDVWYWSSSQHATYSDFAWLQFFSSGLQCSDGKSYEGRARAVRRLIIK